MLFQAWKDLHQSRECLILSRHSLTLARKEKKIAEIKRLIFSDEATFLVINVGANISALEFLAQQLEILSLIYCENHS